MKPEAERLAGSRSAASGRTQLFKEKPTVERISEDWNQKSGSGLGGSHVLYIRDMEVKSSVADLEVKAASGQRFCDVEAVLSKPAVAKKVRNQNMMAIVASICVAALVCLVIFVL